jgi:hypothetical protein
MSDALAINDNSTSRVENRKEKQVVCVLLAVEPNALSPVIPALRLRAAQAPAGIHRER